MLLAPSTVEIVELRKRKNVLVLIASYLLLVFVLPVALSLLVSYRSLHKGNDCPHCRGDTIRLEAPRLDLATRLNPFSSLHRRWCLCCGWEGTSRISRRTDVPAGSTHTAARSDVGACDQSTTPRHHPGQPGQAGAGMGGARDARPHDGRSQGAQTRSGHAAATQTLDVRSLDINGTPWRVMLQCWKGTDLYFGRFVFVGPSGRLWLDAVESFAGRSESEVLDQAQALPEGKLASRLRKLVAE